LAAGVRTSHDHRSEDVLREYEQHHSNYAGNEGNCPENPMPSAALLSAIKKWLKSSRTD